MDKQQSFAEIQERLEASDLRLTPQRAAVVKVLLEHVDTHLRTEEIFLLAKEFAPDIGLATVYRTLEVLERLNIINRFEFGDGQSRYEMGRDSEDHYHHHLICLGCGAISEFEDDLLEKLEGQIAAKCKFKIVDHDLRFFGYCQKCQEKA
ncbi:MAG: transcriptional repressor [Firmicutes bacterium]|jgi:Fur family ferric uptake transcriptional regulator|nr:Fur family transcriptional regulator [Bacillota bacterium]NLL89294.1 transcriptional repressor [Bacillota bacterium]